jgi:hypothetical protein
MNTAISQRNFIFSKNKYYMFRLNWLATIRPDCKNTKGSILCEFISALRSYLSQENIQVWFRKYRISEVHNYEYLQFMFFSICLITLETLSNRDTWEVTWKTDGLNMGFTGLFKIIWCYLARIYSVWIIGLLHINFNLPASTFTKVPSSTDATGSFHFKYLYMVHT